MPSNYQTLDRESVIPYVEKFRPGFGGTSVDELSEGNLNLVFRVHGGPEQSSLIVKQAVPYLRVAGEGWPLTLDRSRIEAEALTLHERFAPGLTPELISYDEDMHVLILEDLRSHVVWRDALVEGRHVAGVAPAIGQYCARTLLGSSVLLMSTDERIELASRLINPQLCAISYDLVFTAPYIDADSNNIDDEARDIAAELQSDARLREIATRLRYEFSTRAEAAIHGDLHTGSIMVIDNDPRVMDPEFAFFGPMGYDLGNVVANLAFARVRHEVLGNVEFCVQIDSYQQEFWASFLAEVDLLWPESEPWKASFLAGLVHDSAQYAAMEMIRRMVGLAHVKDIDLLPAPERLIARKQIFAGAKALLLSAPASDTEAVWARATSSR